MKEAETYRTQGLLAESRDRYMRALELLGKSRPSAKYRKVIDAVTDRIRVVEKDLSKIDGGTMVPKLSPEVQGLIKRLFSSSRTRESATLEGAVALAKFGQYEEAVAEFSRLLEAGTLSVAAAKNILKCHLTLHSTEAAVNQYRQWLARGDLLSPGQLKFLRTFLEDSLADMGVKAVLPSPDKPGSETPEEEEGGENLLDITSVSLPLEKGCPGRCFLELEVIFQSDSSIGLLVTNENRSLLKFLSIGTLIHEIQFYSPVTVFRGSGRITGADDIEDGKYRGGVRLNISIEGD